MAEGKRYALQGFFGPGRDETLNHTPHAAYLGMRVVEIGAGFAICTLPYREEIIGDPQRRVVFGGATAWDRDPADPFASAMGAFMLSANRGGAPFSRYGDGGGARA